MPTIFEPDSHLSLASPPVPLTAANIWRSNFRILVWLDKVYKQSELDANLSADTTQFFDSSRLNPFLDSERCLPNDVSSKSALQMLAGHQFVARPI